LSLGGTAKVCGGCFPICTPGDDPDTDDDDDADDECVSIEVCRSATFTFSALCTWVASFGVGELAGQGLLIVPNIAALAAIDSSDVPQLTRALVQTQDSIWELDKTSTAASDGQTVIPAADGGNWLRTKNPSKKWSLAYLGGHRVNSNVAPFETV